MLADLTLPFDKGASPSDKRAWALWFAYFALPSIFPSFSLVWPPLVSAMALPAASLVCRSANLLCGAITARRSTSPTRQARGGMVPGQHHAIIVHHGTAALQAFSEARPFFLEIHFKRLIGHGSFDLPGKLRIQTRSRRCGFSARRNQETLGCPPPQIRAIALSRARGVNGFRRMSTSSGRSRTASDSA